jgi:murein DD-endopeptidase MepM/ murein hydrolase activator NlpD
MTQRLARTPDRMLTRLPAAIMTVLLTLILLILCAVPPAAAIRSGPDVALRAGDGPGHGTGTSTSPGGARSSSPGYVPPVAGVDPPSGVERRFDPPEEKWGSGHRGVDLLAPAGSNVLSPGPGVVTFAGPVARRGVVVVTHPDGLRTSLEPVAATVPVGAAVATGTTIGVVEDGGTTSNHCAPRSCVHWGVRRGERYIDPLSLLDRPPIVLLPDH